MGSAVDFVGDALGGAADFVGDVAGGIGDFAGDVIEDFGPESPMDSETRKLKTPLKLASGDECCCCGTKTESLWLDLGPGKPKWTSKTERGTNLCTR